MSRFRDQLRTEALSSNRACTAKTRASETDDEALCRKQAAKTRAQKQRMKPFAEKNAIEQVLPKNEPQNRLKTIPEQ